MYPSNQDYKLALMIGADSFRTLEGLEAVPNPFYPTEPWFATGGLAIVFKVSYQGKLYALKCFTKEVSKRQERLKAISAYLKANPSDYFVDFAYYDNEIYVENENGGQGYPIVLMEWVEGQTLDNYLKEKCEKNSKTDLTKLYYNFCTLTWWLHQQPFAHGDLKHDNIIVAADGKLKLIDYDGIYIPTFAGQKATELGSPCYQHPNRSADDFNETLDSFSLNVLLCSLLVYSLKPNLFVDNYNGDSILFKQDDINNFDKSALVNEITTIGNPKIDQYISVLEGLLYINSETNEFKIIAEDKDWINYLALGIVKNGLNKEQIKLKNWILSDEKNKKLFIEIIFGYSPISIQLIEKYNHKWMWRGYGQYGLHNHSIIWSIELIEKYKDKWRWWELSSNMFLPWSIELIEKFKGKWEWGCWVYDQKYGLSCNKTIPWSIELIEKYENNWVWDFLSQNESIPLTMELIKKYENKWDWEMLSKNKSLPMNIELIEKYEDKWDWKMLSSNKSLTWTIELIEKYEDNWDWEMFSSNKSLPWSIELIEKYKDKWVWARLGFSTPLSIELIEKYEDNWDWRLLSINESQKWTIELIEKYKDKWNWLSLSMNKAIPWAIELIQIYEDNWDWELLSRNVPQKLSIDLIEKFKDKLDWGSYDYNDMECGLSCNRALPWSIELIEKYKDKWRWEFLSVNEALPLTIELIKKYEDKWVWELLSKNKSFPWSIEFIDYIRKKTDRILFVNNGQYEGLYDRVFKTHSSDEFIDEIMSEINLDNEIYLFSL